MENRTPLSHLAEEGATKWFSPIERNILDYGWKLLPFLDSVLDEITIHKVTNNFGWKIGPLR